MRYPASEKAEIIKLVEQSHLPAKRTLDKLGVPRATFYYLWTALPLQVDFRSDLLGQLQTSIRRHPVIGSAQMGNPLAPASIAGRPRRPR
jgi:hypothetical protein